MRTAPEGHWYGSTSAFTVERANGTWWVRFPGIESDLGARLHPLGEHWEFDGGPAHGAEIAFTGDTAAIGGVIPFRRRAEAPPHLPGNGIPAPPIDIDADRDAEFARIWQRADGPIDWRSRHPKHAFLQWLMARQEVVFHGSNRRGITRFSTTRESIETDDPTGRGNLQAVYATHDGLWATYFAVVDRARVRGSLRNGVATYLTSDGHRQTRYYLSLPELDLVNRPFTLGTLYMLPRSRFAPIPLYPGGPDTAEWACHEPVEPLASLEIHPDEYPLLHAIGAHEETDRVLYAEAADSVIALGVEVLEVTPQLRVRLARRPPESVISEYITRGSVVWPGTARTVVGDMLTVNGPPEYLAAVATRIGESIRDRAPGTAQGHVKR